jgi:uncharacterized protein
MSATATVGGLYVYPLKGGAAVPLAEVEVTARGLRFDRRWAVASATGRVLTQREHPELARVHAWITGAGTLGLNVEGERFDAPEPGSGVRETVRIWSDEVEAELYGGAVDDALSHQLGAPVRLVHFPDDVVRACDPDVAPDAATAFADGFPVLVTNEATLVWLDERLVELGAEPVPMDRFRPNLVIADAPFNAEDEHATLTVADRVTFQLVSSCTRCIVTTIDQETGEIHGDQPLAALRSLRRHPLLKKPVFGQNAVARLAADESVRIRVGDAVTLAGSAAI